MKQILNAGMVVFDNVFDALPVFIGLVLIVVGLLGLAIIHQLPGADFNIGDGAGMEGPAPLPNEAGLQVLRQGDGDGVSLLRERPGLSGRPGPSDGHSEGLSDEEREENGYAWGAECGNCVSHEAGGAAEADEFDPKGNG